jgi:ATP/maltotriose-dependent transcriptional regulator MalT
LVAHSLLRRQVGHQGRWYSYNPLMEAVLRTEVRREAPDSLRAIHRLAAKWHGARNNRRQALIHWLAAGDPVAAADVILSGSGEAFADPSKAATYGLAGRPEAPSSSAALLRGLETQPAAVRGMPGGSPLSRRETEVLILMATGLANKEIAGRLFVSQATVKAHLFRIYRKLEVSSRTGAVARGRALRIIA